MTGPEVLFAAFGLASQVLLLAYFGARRWAPRVASLLGRIAYGFAGLGVPAALILYANGSSWQLVTGPVLMAAWALFGASVDVWRPRSWRGPPVDWRVLGPYAGLYVVAQMFMWWPLLGFAWAAWVAFLALFVANTGLNLRGHFGGSPRAS